VLEAIGLDEQDEALYDALVRRTQATVPELAEECQVPESATRRAMSTLVEIGLAIRLDGRPTRESRRSCGSANERCTTSVRTCRR
jgi:predicted transcriptional regulator